MFNVKPALVAGLIKNEKTNKNTVAQLKLKEAQEEERRDAIRQSVSDKVEGSQHVWTSGQIQADLV